MHLILVNETEDEVKIRDEYLAARRALREAKRSGVGYPEARERALEAERRYAPVFWDEPGRNQW
jgi:hypothetical protein